jgi:hypothetical protein
MSASTLQRYSEMRLAEINDSQCEVWRKSIEVFEDGRSAPRTVALLKLRSAQRSPMGWVLAGTNNSSWTISGRSVCRPGRKGTPMGSHFRNVIGLSFAKPTGAKANICCGATLLSEPQPRFGNITPGSRKSRKPSKI